MQTSSGPAIFVLTECKLGRRTSTLNLSVYQGNFETLPLVCGYITQSNINIEQGISLFTAYSLSPAPVPLISTLNLRKNQDPNWVLQHNSYRNFRKAGQHVRSYLPRCGHPAPALIDQWLCFENGESFTQDSLGYVADTFPQLVETEQSFAKLEYEKRSQVEGENWNTNSDLSQEAWSRNWARFWYPTVLLNLDIKKMLPPEGVQWLFSRVRYV